MNHNKIEFPVMSNDTVIHPKMGNHIPVSVFIMAYNQQDMIVDAIKSMLQQTYRIDQLVISDDCSTDNTWNTIQAFIASLHEPINVNDISIRRNERNLGLIEHYNTLFSMMKNDFVLAHAGDDISHPLRISKLVELYKKLEKPKNFLIHSQVQAIDLPAYPILTPPIIANGLSLENAALSIALHFGASSIVSKSMWDKFGPITVKGTYEDLVLGFRAALLDSYYYLPEPLLYYRTKGGISDPEKMRSGPDRGSARIYALRIATYKQRLLDCDAVDNVKVKKILDDLLMKYLRLPSDFDPVTYLTLHADVALSGIDPIDHFIHFGLNEHRTYK